MVFDCLTLNQAIRYHIWIFFLTIMDFNRKIFCQQGLVRTIRPCICTNECSTVRDLFCLHNLLEIGVWIKHTSHKAWIPKCTHIKLWPVIQICPDFHVLISRIFSSICVGTTDRWLIDSNEIRNIPISLQIGHDLCFPFTVCCSITSQIFFDDTSLAIKQALRIW